MNLHDDLKEWINTHFDDISDEDFSLLWEYLQYKIGPVQEKLLKDIQMLRDERNQMERKLEAMLNELNRLRQRDNN
jgi:hypothetical protein